MKIRVVTYNVHKCLGGVDRRYDPVRVAEVICHYQPDIVLLQEVGYRARGSTRDRQVDVLAELVDLPHRLWLPNVRLRSGGAYGNAILSRWVLHDQENLNLTIPPKKRRSALHARLRLVVKDGHEDDGRTRTLHLFNMHLGLSGIERRMQLRRFIASARFRRVARDTPALVAGDLNDIWGTLGRKVLGPAGFRGSRQTPKTFPAYAPVRPLDGVYVRGNVQLEYLMASRLKLARQASDHLPLVAELTLE